MFRGLVLAVAIVGLVAVGLVGGQQSAEAQETASATRSLPSEVESGGTLTVTIRVADYGGLGQLAEEFPGDFTFVRSSPAVEPSGQTLTFNLLADTSVSYTLTAPATTETISISGFSGTLEPAVGDGVTVSGPSSVTVSSPPAQPTASATRSLPSEVESGGTLTVTIRVADYGGLGQLAEEFPGDFTFVRSSPAVEPSGQTLTFNLLADTSVSYTLTAPATTETISISGFSGTLEPAVGDGVTVSGPSSVTVSSPPAQPTASATRSLPSSEVESGGTLTVTIRVADYGGLGQLAEEFPGDFTFVRSSPAVEPSGQTLTFNLLADTFVSYTLTAPATTETISISGFSGTLEPAVGDGVTVDGPSSVQVGRPSPPPRPPRPPRPPVQVPTNVEEMGEVTLWASATEALTMAPQVGDTITGAVMDPDGGVTGESWQWARTKTPAMMDSWVDIEDATDDEYTVIEGDTGYYLRVMATYTDAVGTDTAMEYSMPTMMVGAEAGDPLFGYDTSGNGRIDKDELAKAVLDYEINRTLEKPALADLVFSYELGL